MCYVIYTFLSTIFYGNVKDFNNNTAASDCYFFEKKSYEQIPIRISISICWLQKMCFYFYFITSNMKWKQNIVF